MSEWWNLLPHKRRINSCQLTSVAFNHFACRAAFCGSRKYFNYLLQKILEYLLGHPQFIWSTDQWGIMVLTAIQNEPKSQRMHTACPRWVDRQPKNSLKTISLEGFIKTKYICICLSWCSLLQLGHSGPWTKHCLVSPYSDATIYISNLPGPSTSQRQKLLNSN